MQTLHGIDVQATYSQAEVGRLILPADHTDAEPAGRPMPSIANHSFIGCSCGNDERHPHHLMAANNAMQMS